MIKNPIKVVIAAADNLLDTIFWPHYRLAKQNRMQQQSEAVDNEVILQEGDENQNLEEQEDEISADTAEENQIPLI